MAPALPGWHCPAPLTMSEQKDLQKQHQKDQQAIKRLQAGNPLEKHGARGGSGIAGAAGFRVAVCLKKIPAFQGEDEED